MAEISTEIVHTIREFGKCLGSFRPLLMLRESYLWLSAHLPFDRTFPESYPEFLTKDDLAEGYIKWTKKYGVVSRNLGFVTRHLY